MSEIHPNDRVYALLRAVSLAIAAGEPANVIADLRQILDEIQEEARDLVDMVLARTGCVLPWRVEAELAKAICAALSEKEQLHQHLLDMLGAKDHEDAGRIIGELHAKAAQPASSAGGSEPVGETSAMPGSNGGFSVAVFEASKVPVGTKLYAAHVAFEAAQPAAPQDVLRGIVSAHTQGPWMVHVMTGEVSVEAPCGRILFLASIEGDEEAVADAHLIAAAPKLLAAVSAMLDAESTVIGTPEAATYHQRYRAAIQAMRAAMLAAYKGEKS